MRKSDLQALAAIIAALLVGAAVAWAGSRGGVTVGGWPLFVLCAVVAFVIQWLAFIPAWFAQTEHYYDLTGSLTYLTLVIMAYALADIGDTRSMILLALIAIWALRLGSFLFIRVKQDGSDGRFDAIKPHFWRFLMAWTLQGLWVFLTLSAALAAMTSGAPGPLEPVALAGVLIFATGFIIEVVADRQKRAFRRDPANEGRFIQEGLWAWSRHPNYFGEITLWVGIFLIAAPALVGWQWVTILSPLFVIFLLTRVSGIPMLEARARKRWGDDPDYRAYLERTSVLVPWPPSRS